MRTIWVYSNIALWTLIFGLGSYFTILLTGKKKYFRFFANIWGKTLSLIFNIKLEVNGYENLNKKDNYIFAANHCSFIDIPLLCVACKRYLVFVAKSELKKIPIFSQYFKKLGFIFVKRDKAFDSLKILLKSVKKLISKNNCIFVIFPEGTRIKPGERIKLNSYFSSFNLYLNLKKLFEKITLLNLKLISKRLNRSKK